MSRVQRSAIPDTTCVCTVMTDAGNEKWCPYRSENMICDTPRTNKGNSDAACHRIGNAALIVWLEPIAKHPGD